ncbi:esterase family protein [Hoyosella sp. YIM 151337]|uniref:alpha/beta hydrolase n=1 Tax=Hoyosella sp. YIM 151337 TaxID=2992742 RepID=UPI002235F721|nr:alpha/beta hydrolase family protein [Hoyosella sp. YIM 151337]MCW4352055.1 esterase family protein [Hoyosella sp. YIM 151337]
MRLRLRTGALLALALLFVQSSVASAQPGLPGQNGDPETGPPPSVSTTGSYLDRIERISDREAMLYVYSAAMQKVIPLEVITPADNSVARPTLYLLNGAGGGEDSATWRERTDLFGFFMDKNVNVVTPIGGAYTYYTDWINEDPDLGIVKWETFLTRELPPIVDTALGATGRNAIAGLSMSATSVLALAIAAPEVYDAVGSYSGCARTSDRLGEFYVRTVLAGPGDVDNMWGPSGSPAWREYDPYLNAEGLRGTVVYVSSATGLPGPYDTFDNDFVQGSPARYANLLVVGGLLEAATYQCTVDFARRLDELNIPAHINLRPAGTHSWAYWEEDLRVSWPILSEAIGLG